MTKQKKKPSEIIHMISLPLVQKPRQSPFEMQNGKIKLNPYPKIKYGDWNSPQTAPKSKQGYWATLEANYYALRVLTGQAPTAPLWVPKELYAYQWKPQTDYMKEVHIS